MSTAPSAKLQVPTPAAAPRNAISNSQEPGTIGKSLVIKGEITGSESLYIDGRVEGSINLAGNASCITVGRNGVVVAAISAAQVIISGELRGNVVTSDRLDIRNEGSFTGNVVTPRISIEEGAFFKGKVDISTPDRRPPPR